MSWEFGGQYPLARKMLDCLSELGNDKKEIENPVTPQ